MLSTTWIPTAGGGGDTPVPGLPSCQTANHLHRKESNMRRGLRRDDWNRFDQDQNTTLLACFNEQAAEAAVRKVALAAAASTRHRLTILRRFGNTGIRTAGGGGGAVTLSRLPAASLVLLVANPHLQSDGNGAPQLGDHHHLYEHTLRAHCIGS
jgi:hypothetical protein